MPTNGSRVTQKQLFETVMELDGKLSSKMDNILAQVTSNRTANAGEFACLQEGLNGLKTRLEGKGGLIDRIDTIDGKGGRLTVLEHSDRKVGFWASLIGVVSAAIAGILASRN
ncbi:hypothetical protein A3J33_00975 [candidate division WWE3 bacterium RIFCSPLOWO2_02_FULL_53_10]|uniref:Uncharacterized protein n=1 Tax=candidate division WWE3 bacterium RIFCSPLOWO2_02_FULL_53_10 TaxID=1802629 RepID=A0A1F4W5D3_UNCKA|nr:MAG: hypothetical protein A3J33_00975 [candidate division WWE3 bacterium RIFCSPLOWO2_02_FULL_53_10]